jgi:hypothetical protein
VTARAVLIEDRGAAAETPDFFRSRAFLDAEGVTHTLRVEARDATAALPMIVREIPDSDRQDAISPYGYPGGAIEAGEPPAPPPAEVDWSATGLVSAFIRERIGDPPTLVGAVTRSVVQVHDPELAPATRSRFTEQFRHNERLGYAVEAIPGPETTAGERAAFADAYAETMRRAEASERYLYPRSYFDAVLAFDRSWLCVATAPDGVPCAGAIAALSDGVLHYYLGGTADVHLADSPFKNVVARMRELAEELGTPLNLGGGVTAGDGLEDFKRGFANRELDFRTHEVVCDRSAYERLAAGREGAAFFPAYRAP